MDLKQFIKIKGMKKSVMADTIGIDRGSFNRRVDHNNLRLDELKILRINKVLSLEDIDLLTS